MANKRIYYAIQQVGFADFQAPGVYTEAHGVQSVGITTNFSLEQVFQLGELAIYENIEEIPDVEVTLNKVLDGYPLLFHMATQDEETTAPTLAGRSNSRTQFAMSIFSDTLTSATGTPGTIMECSGMYVSSVSYTFPVDGNSTEDVTLVGNDKIWSGDTRIVHPSTIVRRDALSFDGKFDDTDLPLAKTGVQRRQDLLFGNGLHGMTPDTNGASTDPNISVLPREVYGVTSSGTNELAADGNFGAHVNNITLSADFGREQINELGRKGPYHRFVTFPVEVTCEVEVTSGSGDMISATEAGILTTSSSPCSDSGNLYNGTIRLASCDDTRLYLGTKNKLASVNYTGGDAGGGNVSVSYTFTTFNDFTVLHSQDPHESGSNWWTNRSLYLTG